VTAWTRDLPGIEAVELRRDFKGGVRAVDRLSLTVARGEIYGLLGPNGAGKSTTVLMLTTLLVPTAGSARVGGFDVVVEPREVRRLAGATLQDVALDPLLTGHEHLRLQGALQGLGGRDGRRRAKELLVQVGLEGAAHRRVGGYSGGMKRRLDLAMALVHRPSILFLDEPTTGLDPASRLAIWAEVTRLATEHGVAVLLTTHYLEEADALADRVGIVDRGRIVVEGTPSDLKSRAGRATVEITPTDPATVTPIVQAVRHLGDVTASGRDRIALRVGENFTGLAVVNQVLDAAGIAVAGAVVHPPTLEDVFLAATGRTLEAGANAPTGTPDPLR
jgi:ABC-2 type transport system ATP-binding protein